MDEAMFTMILFGAGIIVLALILVGIFAFGRSRKAPHEASDGDVPAPAPAESGEIEAPRPSAPEPVRLYLEANGTASVEIEGRRFTRLSDIMDDRLAQRASAAVGAMQRFAGIASEAKPTPATLNDELRAGHAPEDGVFLVEFHGQRYRKLTEVRDGETGRQLLALIGKLVSFGRGLAVPPSVTEAKPAKPESVSEDEFLRQLATSASGPKPLRMPSLVESFESRRVKVEPMPLGIAGQIDKILQQQLLDNTMVLGQSIRLVTAKDGSLEVEVEGRRLKWPDGVDPIVREAIQNAIRTWEGTVEV
jgi:hypothetical protein